MARSRTDALLDDAKPPRPGPERTPRESAAPKPRAQREPFVGIKHFVLDTNVLLHDPNALFVFQEHHVVIPYPVIEELDSMKRREDDVGRNARECIRHLDRLRNLGKLTEGVEWGHASVRVNTPAGTVTDDGKTGTVRIDVNDYDRPPAIHLNSPDNRIIAVAWHLHQDKNNHAVFVSKDLSARIKSDSLGIRTEDFENQKVDADRLYTGYATCVCPGELIDELYREKHLPIQKLLKATELLTPDGHPLAGEPVPNQFIVLHDLEDEAHSGLARRLADTDTVVPITGPRKPTFGIMARNVQQTMALDLLLDDDVKMVTLLGSAGTGKTLLAVAAGMHKVFNEERFDKLLVARPIMPLGRDIGYLPGTKDEKLSAWMQPIFDNLTYLLSTRGGGGATPDSHTPEQRINKLMADGKLVLEPLTYIRGRSIPHQFMIVDEAQNLTPHEIKTIASRVGEGTKLVLTGDVGQIDNPYLDSSSNGLSYAAEKLKGLGIVGHVTLAKSERSELASIAASRL